MKSVFISIAFIFSLPLYAQDTTRVADSVQTNIVQVTPYFSQNLHTSGNYVKKIDDAALHRFSTGVSIFNALRGHVPGLVISPYAVTGVPGFRYEFYSQKSASLLLDGIPLNASIVDYLNFNTSEFSAISVLPSANALSFLDLPTNGAIALVSKSGEGFDKPAFEYNTNLLAGWEDHTTRTGTYTEKDWNLYNSVSYSQDFGNLDIRASYSAMNRWLRPGSFASPMSHFLKFNTGYKLGDRGEVRAILVTTLRKREIDYTTGEITTPFPIPADTVNEQLNQQFLTANISAKYRLSSWLNVTGQISVSAHDSTFNRVSAQYSYSRQRKDGQTQANAYALANKLFGSSFEVSGFAGIQHATMSLSLVDFTGKGEQNFILTYLSAGTSVGFKKYLFTNVLLKVPLSENDKMNYSVSGSFMFSELLKNLPISSGKIRASFGKNLFTDDSSYPRQRSIFIASRQIRPVTSLEWGGDFSFLDKRLSVSLTHFNDKWEVNLPGVSELERKGIEGDISYLLIRKSNSNFKTGAVFSFFGDDDFRGSLLAQLTKGKSFVNIIVERLSITTLADSQSFTRFREVTVGQNISGAFLKNTWLKHINSSISVRNIHDFQASKYADYEKQNFDFIKSVNLNLAMIFQ